MLDKVSFEDFEVEDLLWRMRRSAEHKRVLRLQYEVLLAIKRLKELPRP